MIPMQEWRRLQAAAQPSLKALLLADEARTGCVAAARHRSSVAVEILSSRETVSTAALSGGNNRVTALSLNACPYLATSSFRYRPRVSDYIEAATILTQRVLLRASHLIYVWTGL